MTKGIKNVTNKTVQEKNGGYHINAVSITSIFGIFITSCLAVLMIASCDNPTFIDELDLEDQSSLKNNSQTNLKDIELIYRYKCSICHGKNGVSVIKDAPDLVSTEFTIEERVAIIVYGKGTMPPQKDVLDMPTIRGLAVYIDSLK
jgi:mono/diheme cytochrome c family protein